jgi:DNA-binding MarR family transcriptional regulator
MQECGRAGRSEAQFSSQPCTTNYDIDPVKWFIATVNDDAADDHSRLREAQRAMSLKAARITRLAYPKRYAGAWTPADMQVVQYLASEGPCSGSEVAKSLAMDDTTVASSMRRLISRGMVYDRSAPDRQPGQNRKRTRGLTPEGEELAERHLDYWLDRRERWEENRDEDFGWDLTSRYQV